LKSEETRFKNRKISPTIVADVKRFSHQIKRTKFSAHTRSPGALRVLHAQPPSPVSLGYVRFAKIRATFPRVSIL
jgi:hypothetical protein